MSQTAKQKKALDDLQKEMIGDDDERIEGLSPEAKAKTDEIAQELVDSLNKGQK